MAVVGFEMNKHSEGKMPTIVSSEFLEPSMIDAFKLRRIWFLVTSIREAECSHPSDVLNNEQS